MPERHVPVAFYNIVATPHPEGAYHHALDEIAAIPFNYRGRDFAVLFKPEPDPDDDRFLRGRMAAWTDINPKEPSIDKATFEEVKVEEELAEIFEKRGFNNRGFSWVFDVQTHTLAHELENEIGQTISPMQIERILEHLLSSLNGEGQTYEVTLIPREDAVGLVLGLARLDTVTIILKRDNIGDHDDGDADDVLRELEEQNTKRQYYHFSRQPGTDSIKLNEKNRARADAAPENGLVASTGYDAHGNHQSLSTEKYPDIVGATVPDGGSIFHALKSKLFGRA